MKCQTEVEVEMFCNKSNINKVIWLQITSSKALCPFLYLEGHFYCSVIGCPHEKEKCMLFASDLKT